MFCPLEKCPHYTKATKYPKKCWYGEPMCWKGWLAGSQKAGGSEMIKVPSKCLICGSDYMGGHQLPRKEMKEGLRVFYDCGASMSVKTLGEGVYQILFKNCSQEGMK